jgi:hypothetical protein
MAAKWLRASSRVNKVREGELPVNAEEILWRSVCQTDEYLELFGKNKEQEKLDWEKWCPPVYGYS